MLSLLAAVDIKRDFAFGGIATLGQGVSLLVNPVFSIAALAVVIYFVIGAFKWLTSAGNKDAISGAQRMITHAIIGFIILMFAFLILQFLIGSLFEVNLNILEFKPR